MAKSNRKDMAYFPETATWHTLRPIKNSVVEPQSELSQDKASTVPFESEVQFPVNHDFSDTFKRGGFHGETVRKGEFNNFVTRLCKIQSHNFFDFPLCFHIFNTDGNATDQPRLNGSTNPELI